MTYAEKIRAMTDKQLAKFLKEVDTNGFPKDFCLKKCPKKNDCPLDKDEDNDCPYNCGYADGWLAYLQEESEVKP